MCKNKAIAVNKLRLNTNLSREDVDFMFDIGLGDMVKKERRGSSFIEHPSFYFQSPR